jgi:RHS repeat-associated protein
LITDGNGQTYQTLAYTPYGSQLVDIKHYSDIYNEPYRFTGYEKDGESGLNHANARCYDENTGFTSVDPLAEQAPEISGYHYCHWSPIMRTDPTGLTDPELHPNPDKNVNIQNANACAKEMQKKYGNKNGDIFSVEAYKGDKDVEYAKVVATSPNGKKDDWAWFQSDEKQNVLGWIKNGLKLYDIKEGHDNGANQRKGTAKEAIIGGAGAVAIFLAPLLPEIIGGSSVLLESAVITVEGSAGASMAAGAIEGVTKGLTNAPTDTPYLIPTPEYKISSDFWNFTTTIILEQSNHKKQ